MMPAPHARAACAHGPRDDVAHAGPQKVRAWCAETGRRVPHGAIPPRQPGHPRCPHQRSHVIEGAACRAPATVPLEEGTHQ
jgi:hypothetical protein